MKYMIIENDIDLIKQYDQIGVDRIFLDLEILGKHERQGHLDTVISNHHSLDDIKKIKPILKHSELLVRINPVHSETANEIERCIEDGADIVMLPMFKTASEVKYFVDKVNKRAKACLLLETSEALCRIDDILAIEGIDEIHIGLNDLHLALGVEFMFELLTGGIVEYLADKIKKVGISFGFGGVATCKGGLVPGEFVLSEHVRLGSSMVILSRAFKKMATEDIKHFQQEFNALQSAYSSLAGGDGALLLNNQKSLKKAVNLVVDINSKEG